MQGTVKWFSYDKGYGFIEPDDESGDKFVHWTGWRDGHPAQQRSLATGEPLRNLDGRRVEFDLEEGRKGLECRNVVLLVGDPAA